MSLPTRFLIVSSVFLLSITVRAQTFKGPQLLVTNQGDRDVSFIDPTGHAKTFALPENAVTGHEIAASPDGRTAYVPIYGDSGVGRAGTNGSTMLVVDVPSRTVTHTVDFGHGVRPHLPVYDARRNLLFVSTELDQTISIIDPHSLKIVGAVPTGQAESHMFAIAHQGHLAYSANVGPGTVSVLDLDARKTVAVLPIAPHVQRISISKDDKFVFTSDTTTPRLAVLDTGTRKVKTWIALPSFGYGSAVTPDGKWVVIAIPATGQVGVIDLATLTLAHTIATGGLPQEVLITPDGGTAFVSCKGTNQIAKIDLKSWKLSGTLPAGVGADGLAWAVGSR